MGTTVPVPDRQNVEALIVDELRRLHEGVLARYGLRPLQLALWRAGRAALLCVALKRSADPGNINFSSGYDD